MLSIYFRYIDQNEEIREVFQEFLELEKIIGSEIGNTILIFFEKKGIDIKNYAMTGHPIYNQEKLL